MDRRPLATSKRTALVACLAVACGGYGDDLSSPDAPPVDPIGRWTPLGLSLEPRNNLAAVSTGTGAVLWGGAGACTEDGVCGSGARVDPTTASMSGSTSTAGAPSPRRAPRAVWSGEAMLVWGGHGCGSLTADCTDGAAYDPTSDTWTPIAGASAPSARGFHAAVWTGTEMIVWGGWAASTGKLLGDGARYDPGADAWRSLASAGAPSARRYHRAVWTGHELVVWGGDGDASSARPLGDGARYDPATDTWRPMSSDGAPSSRYVHAMVWTGREVLVWGGACGIAPNLVDCRDGAAYDPAADSWRRIPTAGAPRGRQGDAVWTGREMIVWGGCRDDGCSGPAAGGAYDPEGDAWSPLASDGAPIARGLHAMVWASDALVVWGGVGAAEPNATLSDGAIWRR